MILSNELLLSSSGGSSSVAGCGIGITTLPASLDRNFLHALHAAGLDHRLDVATSY
jgi:hypothetical protein